MKTEGMILSRERTNKKRYAVPKDECNAADGCFSAAYVEFA